MDEIILIEKPITKAELKPIAEKRFGDMVKAVVDVEKNIMPLVATYMLTKKPIFWKKARPKKIFGV